ncbi:hypothetical protein HELRODRAFT_106954, partial [Helobdella robusta]|uniref:Uncharacterized protein n=1 Tax=Helobdella robusta TaxID=6412 RepID=T1EE62_HELRO
MNKKLKLEQQTSEEDNNSDNITTTSNNDLNNENNNEDDDEDEDCNLNGDNKTARECRDANVILDVVGDSDFKKEPNSITCAMCGETFENPWL